LAEEVNYQRKAQIQRLAFDLKSLNPGKSKILPFAKKKYLTIIRSDFILFLSEDNTS